MIQISVVVSSIGIGVGYLNAMRCTLHDITSFDDADGNPRSLVPWMEIKMPWDQVWCRWLFMLFPFFWLLNLIPMR